MNERAWSSFLRGRSGGGVGGGWGGVRTCSFFLELDFPGRFRNGGGIEGGGGDWGEVEGGALTVSDDNDSVDVSFIGSRKRRREERRACSFRYVHQVYGTPFFFNVSFWMRFRALQAGSPGENKNTAHPYGNKGSSSLLFERWGSLLDSLSCGVSHSPPPSPPRYTMPP